MLPSPSCQPCVRCLIRRPLPPPPLTRMAIPVAPTASFATVSRASACSTPLGEHAFANAVAQTSSAASASATTRSCRDGCTCCCCCWSVGDRGEAELTLTPLVALAPKLVLALKLVSAVAALLNIVLAVTLDADALVADPIDASTALPLPLAVAAAAAAAAAAEAKESPPRGSPSEPSAGAKRKEGECPEVAAEDADFGRHASSNASTFHNRS